MKSLTVGCFLAAIAFVFQAQTVLALPVAAFCNANSGKKVGNGECWTLADEAFKSAGKRRPGNDLRVWGRTVKTGKEAILAGDIVEFQSARFSGGIITGSNHTAVVVVGGTGEKFTIAEQNVSGRKKVSTRVMSLKTLVSGKVTIYRPA